MGIWEHGGEQGGHLSEAGGLWGDGHFGSPDTRCSARRREPWLQAAVYLSLWAQEPGLGAVMHGGSLWAEEDASGGGNSGAESWRLGSAAGLCGTASCVVQGVGGMTQECG